MRALLRYSTVSIATTITLLFPCVTHAQDAALQTALTSLDRSAVKHLLAHDVLALNHDGYAVLNDHVTRATFMQAVVSYVYPGSEHNVRCLEELDPSIFPGVSFDLLFSDVPITAPYALELCTAMRAGIIWGYSDGSFRPNATINYAEAAKIINHAFALDYHMAEYPNQLWYASYVENIAERHAVPSTVRYPSQALTVQESDRILAAVFQSLSESTIRKNFPWLLEEQPPTTYPNESPQSGSSQLLFARDTSRRRVLS